ncbi:MAG: RNA polymerase sigma factor [Ginsengibacter sp.]|jgi:RNA polymerase sigma-70 factor (ECF subfamily)
MPEKYSKLIKDCIRSHTASQRQLYDLFAPAMLGVCFRYTKNMDDAEDILQDGFVKVFNNLHQFKNEGELGGWIRRIIVNTALSFLKTNSRYQHDLLFEDMPLHAVSTDDPEVLLNAKELSGLIRQLPPGFQTIFNLYAVEGYSHVEIGSMLGIRDSTSRSQYARARVLLIQWIEKTSLKEKEGQYGKK